MTQKTVNIDRLRKSAHSIATLTPSAQELIARYQSLHIQGLHIVCPYHINCGQRGRHRALVGKGRPEEIERAAERYLKKFQMYANGDADRLQRYLIACGIGVDCSGLAAWILDCLTQERLRRPIWKCLTFPGMARRVISRLRPLENISANLLTGPLNAQTVTDISEARPGDMVRLIGGGHIVVVSEVGMDAHGQALYFAYVQSTTSYGQQNGVDSSGVVILSQPAGSLSEQKWADPLIYEALGENAEVPRLVRLKTLS